MSSARPAGSPKLAPAGAKLPISAPLESNFVTLLPYQLSTQTLPELSSTTTTGQSKLAPAGAKLPTSAPFESNSVTPSKLLHTQTLPELSTARPAGSPKLAPGGAKLSASVQSAGAELSTGSNSVRPGGGETPKIVSAFAVGLVTIAWAAASVSVGA